MSPNLFLIYVTDIDRSTDWYARLFEMEPVLRTPRYVPFEVAPGVLFALWTGRADQVHPDVIRTSEVGVMLAGGPEAIDETYAKWTGLNATVVEPPHDDVFGRTFLVADPDGNLVRVSPLD